MQLDKHTFQKHIQKHALFSKEDRLILAVSGGIDSMVLAHLLQSCKYDFGLAHVNFGLRGTESDGDEEFVKIYAEQQCLPLYSKRIKCEEFESSSEGVQAAARRLRYVWFEELQAEIDVKYILLAHQQSDQSETILHQFIRGGMLAALRGMQDKRGIYVRPLLAFSREEIEHYAFSNDIKWREDSSNQSNKYTRNFIRHELLPTIKKINPDLDDSLSKRAVLFGEIEHLVNENCKMHLEENIEHHLHKELLSCSWLEQYPYKHVVMWHWLSSYSFTSSQIEGVIALLAAQSGSFIDSSSHRILKDRDHLVLSEKGTTAFVEYSVFALPFSTNRLRFEESSLSEVRFDNPSIHYLDLDKVEFPLQVRTWKEGDKIRPLGMRGTQKVSDVLIQNKISLTDKREVVVVLDKSGSILSIPTLRLADDMKITSTTRRILKIQAI